MRSLEEIKKEFEDKIKELEVELEPIKHIKFELDSIEWKHKLTLMFTIESYQGKIRLLDNNIKIPNGFISVLHTNCRETIYPISNIVNISNGIMFTDGERYGTVSDDLWLEIILNKEK